jgi:hypothetical protein
MVVLLPPFTLAYGAMGAALAASLAAACGAAVATLLARSLPAAPADRRLVWMVAASLLGAGASLLLQQAGLAWWTAGALAVLLYTLSLLLTGALSGDDLRRLKGSLTP